MSEAATSKEELSPYCKGLGLDVGFGGQKMSDDSMTLTMDMPVGYCPPVGSDKQILKGSATDLSFLCDGVLSWIGSCHLLEDWVYPDLVNIITEWRRVLAPNGYWVTNCPNQQAFLAHCAKTGQGINEAHKCADFSLETFKSEVVNKTGPWEIVFEKPNHGPYSFLLVCRKIA